MRLAAVLAIVIFAAFAPTGAVALAADQTVAAAPQLGEVARLRRDGQYEKAIALARAGLAAAEKAFGAQSYEAARWLDQLANTLAAAGRYAEAEAVFKREIAAYSASRGPQSAEAGLAFARLGGLYIDMQRFGDAERALGQGLAIVEKARGPEHRDTAEVLNSLALLYSAQGRLRKAEELLKRVVAIEEKILGPEHQDTAAAVSNLAEIYRHMGRPRVAEPLVRRALATDERHYGADSPQAASDLFTLASLMHDLERFDDSEQLFRRTLGIYERKVGDHSDTALTLGAFADSMLSQGRYGEAEPMLKRALAIYTKIAGPSHAETAQTMGSLALLYRLQGRTALAREGYVQAYRVLEKALGPKHRRTAQALGHLGELEREAGRLPEAEAAFISAIGIYETALDPGDLRTVGLRSELARVRFLQGRFDDAEQGFRAALVAFQGGLPREHPAVGSSYYWLARTLLAQKKFAEAYAKAQVASALTALRKSRAVAQRMSGGLQYSVPSDDVFALEARTAFALAQTARAQAPALRDVAFAAAQRATFDETGRAVAYMASRMAAGNDALAALLREQQDLLLQLSALDQRLADAIGARDRATRAQTVPLAAERAAVSARLKAIDAALRRVHPAYAELADPKALSVAETQALLGADEAVVLAFVLDEQTLLFAVTKTDARWASSDATAASLQKDVAALRDQLDPTGWQQSFMPFDRALSHRLFRGVWQPIEAALEGKKSVFVVPSGPLTSLPFAALITAAPQGGATGDNSPAALRASPWLVKRHAVVTLPSVSSLKALRHYAAKGTASEPFAGFGDPALGANAEASARGVGSLYRGTVPDLNALRSLSPLPHTGVELRMLAKTLGAGDADVFLRERATEARVKSLDLSKKRVIAFATHGIVAGEFGFGEPGLVLTPPAAGSATDDGYLAASEVARLNLRAEWVILSACNTAAGNGPGAKGLSGLARSFFLAGAKSMLVAQWPVWDDVSSRITTTTVKNFQADRRAGRGEALRQTMLSLMADEDEARYAHPAAWAPFILVGETRGD